MNKALLFSIVTMVLISSCQYSEKEIKHLDFSFSYVSAGLGSNYNSMRPVFRIKGNEYLYTLEENSSFDGTFSQTPDTICLGFFRTNSIDSIIGLAKQIEDSTLYATNAGIMSGTIETITITSDSSYLEITLHNTSHSLADKIVKIVNSNIPSDKRKLYLSGN
jgi:hypothetical protein